MFVKQRSLLLATTALLWFSCSGGATPVQKTKDILYASESTVKSLDPHDTSDTYSAAIERAIMQGLMGFDKDLKLLPLLAESYEFNDQATVFTLKLRQGIQFQDGVPFDAAAVKVNIDRLMTGKYKRSSLLEPVDKFVVVDDYTVRFELKSPFGAFLNALAHPGTLMVSPKALEEYGDQVSEHPVGTGPYIFDEWVAGSYVRIKKNSSYWKGEVKADTITFQPVPEGGSRLAMLQAKQADFIYPMPSELLPKIQNNPDIDIVRQPSIIERYLVMDLRSTPFSDVRVRQAVNYALDKQTIIRIAWGGAAQQADSIMPPNLAFYKKQRAWPYDVEKAKELMAEAGYTDGFAVVFLTPNASQRLRAIEMVQQQLQQIGITGNIESSDTASFYSRLKSNRVDGSGQRPFIAFGGWSASTGDADWGTRPLLATSGFPPNLSNYGFFSDPKVDQFIADGLSSAIVETRKNAYQQLQDYIWNKAPWGYLFVDTMISAKSKNVSGIYMLPDGAFYVEEADKIVQ